MNRFLLGFVASLMMASDHVGVWKIESARTAPWWKGSAAPAAPLVGKRITFAPRSIAGPHPLGCVQARYVFVDTPAEGLFQGNFDEMRRTNPSGPSPVQLAAMSGLRASSGAWRTLQTGCEIDFHLVDDRTAVFALDNSIYTIRKQ